MRKKRSTDRLSNEDYEYVCRRTPRACLDLAIVDHEGAMLIVKRAIKPYNGQWCFPGGRRFYKESRRDTIRRILKTELGIKLQGEPQLVDEMEFLRDGSFIHSVSNVYRITITDEEKARIRLDEQGGQFRFVHAAPRNMQRTHRRFCIAHNILRDTL